MSAICPFDPSISTDKCMTLCQLYVLSTLPSPSTSAPHYVSYMSFRPFHLHRQVHDTMSTICPFDPSISIDKCMTLCQLYVLSTLPSPSTSASHYVNYMSFRPFHLHRQVHDTMSAICPFDPSISIDKCTTLCQLYVLSTLPSPSTSAPHYVSYMSFRPFHLHRQVHDTMSTICPFDPSISIDKCITLCQLYVLSTLPSPSTSA
jgi:hypothetical protein